MSLNTAVIFVYVGNIYIALEDKSNLNFDYSAVLIHF